MLKKNNLIWVVFYFLLFLLSLNIPDYIFGLYLGMEKNIIYRSLVIGLPMVLLVLHSLITLSILRAIYFIILALFSGWIMEVWGLNSGTVFGGHYAYRMNQVSFFGVPILVIFYWGVFIYTGYCVVNSFIYWLNKQKPSRNQKNFWLLPIMVLFDGLVVVAIDWLMDPIQVRMGSWIWLDGGPYFGVPLGNFIGWFWVTIIVTGIFRIFEYLSPKKVEYDKTLFIIPVIDYGVLAICFTFMATKYQMYSLAIIGNMPMFLIVIVNVIFFTKWKKSRKINEVDA